MSTSDGSGNALGIFGAGSVGCYLGGRLAAAGTNVVLVGRARLKAEIEASGLTVTEIDGSTIRAQKERLTFTTDPASLARCKTVLVCVKSGQTEGTAQELVGAGVGEALVVSMQNGVRNPEVLRQGLPKGTVLGGIVGFNVVSKGGGEFRRATTGPLVIEATRDPRAVDLATALRTSGLEVEVVDDIRPLQWSKLVINLNNAISALSDRPTKELLDSRGYRELLAAMVEESLAVLRKSNIRPARLGFAPVSVFPMLLRLPTPIFRVAARAQLKVDPEARASMWEDLAHRRLTEVDYLNGEIVRLADSCGAPAPLNRRMVDLVHEVEKEGRGSPGLSPDALWQALKT
jgi:2-dehydropantoate 2-reductase